MGCALEAQVLFSTAQLGFACCCCWCPAGGNTSAQVFVFGFLVCFFVAVVAGALRVATAPRMLLFLLLCFRAGALWVATGPSSTARSVAAPAALGALGTPLLK